MTIEIIMLIKVIRKLVFVFLAGLLLANLFTYFHAYKFTHFDTNITVKTNKPEDLSFGEKIKTIAFGLNNPKPFNEKIPDVEFENVYLASNTQIECWDITAENSKGTVVIFHGFSGKKSSMLDKADVFLGLGYSVFLVDFMGCGGSEGNQSTIGFKEALDVKTCVDYLTKKGENNIILFGTSMGSAAIMKAINDHQMLVAGIIIECPFGTMLQTVKSRFEDMGLPGFPLAHLLVFWGGVQNGFNAFKHNPSEYAKNIHCPTLLLYGEKDRKVSRSEINDIFSNMQGEKFLRTYPDAGHENYLLKYHDKCQQDIEAFLVSDIDDCF